MGDIKEAQSNRYINEAIAYYNKLQRQLILEKKLKIESDIVKADSMAILKGFEEIDYTGQIEFKA